MKTLHTSNAMSEFRQILAVIILSIAVVPAMGQCMYLHIVSGDTIYAGMANHVVVVDSGNYSQDNLGALLAPRNGIDFPPCRNCFGDTIKADEAITDGYLTTLTFNLPLGTYPNIYQLTVVDTLNGTCLGYHSTIWVLSKPYVFTSPEDQIICYGEDALLNVIAYEPEEILYQWYHFDDLLEGETSSSLYIDNAGPGDEGLYQCILKNQWGEATTSCSLSLYPFSADPGVPEGPDQFCKGSGVSSYHLPENPSIAIYDWILLPAEAGTLQMDGRHVSVQWNPDFTGEALLFAGTGSEICFGPNSDTLTIRVVGPSTKPELCIVGVDETSGKYRVVWNKMIEGSIIGYNVYRESNQAGIFLKLKFLAADEFSVYVDSTSSPEALPHSYRISYSDTCGNESDLSPVHTTVHLTANLGTGGEHNLSWTPYQGFAFLSYTIYRGTHPDSLQAFQEISSNVTSFTDIDPPSQRLYYQIVVSRDGACQPAKKAGIDYSISRSNVFELSTIGIGHNSIDQSVMIYPNPAKQFIHVKLPAYDGSHGCISIFDITGNQIAFIQLEGDLSSIPVATLPNGVYLLKVTTDRFTSVERFVVRR